MDIYLIGAYAGENIGGMLLGKSIGKFENNVHKQGINYNKCASSW